MTLDPRPGGCFRERLPGGGGVEHLRVVSAAPGTSVTLRYAVAARRTGGTALAPAVDAALAEQVARLKTAAGHR